LEINASDVRNKDAINSVVGGATQQMSLFGKGKIVLVDEVDGLSGHQDRGGVPALARLIERSAFPIVMTAVDPFTQKLKPLKKKSELIELKCLDHKDIFKGLKRVCKLEKISFKDEDLKGLAHRAGSDMRAAISDLQVLTHESKKLTKQDVDSLSNRNREEDIKQALLRIFKSSKTGIAINALRDVNLNPDESMMWIDENLPKEYKKAEDLAKAYDSLSKADVFRGRIRRWQHWRFLVYMNALMTAGIALSKKSKYKEVIKYERTKRILKLWIAKQRYLKRKSIAEKIAEKTHSSTKKAIKEVFYYKSIFKSNKKMANNIADYLELDKEEVDWLRK
jgi:replication factor C large subunit